MNGIPNVGRDQGELTLEEVQIVNAQIIEAIRPVLQARRFMPFRRAGDNAQMWVKTYQETDMSEASLTMNGKAQSDDIVLYHDQENKVPVIQKTFTINWRDLMMSRSIGEGLQVQSARNAARQVANVEDKLAITGEYGMLNAPPTWPALGIEGLATATGRLTQACGAWPANAIANINSARAQLQAAGFVGTPFILILRPAQVKGLDGLIANTAVSYRTAILNNGLVSAIYESTNLFANDAGTDSGIVCVPDRMNFELLETFPLTVGSWEYKDGDIYGHVRECVTPAIYRPTSICEMTNIV